MKVGLFFGSFNPIHSGHMIIANIMAESTDLDKVWFVVSPQNPFKKSESLLNKFDRLNMVKAATVNNDNFEVSEVEFLLPTPSYTIDTLSYLNEKNPDTEFALILGADNLASLPRWKNFESIIGNYNLYVYPRPQWEKSELIDHPSITQVDAPFLDISGTFIRKCVMRNQSIRYLVPDSVQELIRIGGFYLDQTKKIKPS